MTNPSDADAWLNLALIFLRGRRASDALRCFDRVVALRPNHARAHCHRGTVLTALERLDEAIASFDRALALEPRDAEAHNNRACALNRLGRLDEALSSCERALAYAPDYAQAHCNKGNALHDMKRAAEALACFDRAIALQRDFAEAHNARGSALATLNRYEDAVRSFERALDLAPDDAETHNNRGNAFQSLRRFEPARSCYERALALKPDYASAHWNRSILDLRLGRLPVAWPSHEYRWQLPKAPPHRHGQLPQWRGEAVAGKRVLLWSEQGLGDTVQFCRYVPKVAALGARVVLEVQPGLKGLMGSLEGAAEVHALGDPIDACHLQVPLLSLPLAFGTDLTTIPAPVPYLAADSNAVARWRERLGPCAGELLIGIACSGSAGHGNDRNRSIALSRFAPLYRRSQLVLLQTQVRAADEAELRNSPVQDLRAELRDFADTAALIECLDLVISVDTAVVHLAGALGKPVWVLLSSDADWRWMLDRADSPWYPSARLFRQKRPDEWTLVIEEVVGALDDLRPGPSRR